MKTTITKTITLNDHEVKKILQDFIVNSGLLDGDVTIVVRPTYCGKHIHQLIATSSFEQEDKKL